MLSLKTLPEILLNVYFPKKTSKIPGNERKFVMPGPKITIAFPSIIANNARFYASAKLGFKSETIN